MDVRMPDLDGISATREVLAVSPEIKVAILTTFEQDDYIFGALNAGASGFLLKRTKPEELLAAIPRSPRATRSSRLGHAKGDRAHVATPVADPSAESASTALTPREREVLELIARGLSNGEIATAFVIEESTVKTHVKRILMKLRLRDRVQAVIFAYESGLTSPGGRDTSSREREGVP